MRIIKAKIEGVAPGLLMHRFPEMTAAQLVNNVKLAGKGKDTPENEAESCAYRHESGYLCQPAEHIFQSMLKAATGFVIQGRGKKTYKDAVKGGLLIAPDYILHKTKDYLIDARPVRVQSARIVRHRPHIPAWELEFEITILDESILPPDVVNAILVQAGQQVGIGDYRPRYGRFIVTAWDL